MAMPPILKLILCSVQLLVLLLPARYHFQPQTPPRLWPAAGYTDLTDPDIKIVSVLQLVTQLQRPTPLLEAVKLKI